MRAWLVALVVALAATGCGDDNSIKLTLVEQATKECPATDFTGAYKGDWYPDRYGNVTPILAIRPSKTTSLVGGTTEAVRLAEARYSESLGWVITCFTGR